MSSLDMKYVAAPMINQSDLPFRLLVRKYGATMAYTQMLMPDMLLNDPQYLEYQIRDLNSMVADDQARPVVVQLGGNDPQSIVEAGRKLQGFCDAIDLNIGCPQNTARDGHFGAYLLGQKDWPLLQEIVSAMSHSFTVPVSAKLRLCQPSSKTVDLAERLEACGASWITLHARTVCSRQRRRGAADLAEVKRLKESLQIPVISNGNVRVFEDLQENLQYTGADGLMVGETLLGNACLFAGTTPDPVSISLEYLEICRTYPGTATLTTIQTHVRHIVDFQCSRRSWYPKFRAALGTTKTVEDIEMLLKTKVKRWRGHPPRYAHHDTGRDWDDVAKNAFSDSVKSSNDGTMAQGSLGESFYLDLLH